MFVLRSFVNDQLKARKRCNQETERASGIAEERTEKDKCLDDMLHLIQSDKEKGTKHAAKQVSSILQSPLHTSSQ